MAWMIGLPLLVLLIVLLVWAVLGYNRLVRLRNLVRNGWADIDVQLQRRHDLVPPLVDIVRAYAAHEKSTMQLVTELRAQAMQTSQPGALAGLEAQLEAGLGRLLALREAYPQLKADANFRQLQQALVEVEENLQFSRRFYNGAVRDFNTAIEKVPDVLIARAFGFAQQDYFQAGEASRAAVRVSLP